MLGVRTAHHHDQSGLPKTPRPRVTALGAVRAIGIMSMALNAFGAERALAETPATPTTSSSDPGAASAPHAAPVAEDQSAVDPEPTPEAGSTPAPSRAGFESQTTPQRSSGPAPVATPTSAPARTQLQPPNPAPAPPAEPAPVVGALLSDVERLVVAVEDEGWFIDERAYAEIEPLLLESVCRTPQAERMVALQILERGAQVDPETLFVQTAYEMTDEVEDALSARRRWTALKRSLARSNECPFFSMPSYEFTGRQTTRDKWAVHAEGGGLVSLGRTHRRYAAGGGGSGRLLLGRGFGDAFSILAGAEVGGGADLNPPSDEEQLTLKYTAAVPVLFRSRSVAWHYDFEVAPIAMLEAENTRLSWGARGGFAMGLSSLRVRDFLPWAGAAITLEHYFPSGGRDASQVLRGGLRIGFRWLP